MRCKLAAAIPILLLGLLLTVTAYAQDPSTREESLQEVVQLLREELAAKNAHIDSLELDIADLRSKIALTEQIQQQKDIQINLHQDNNELLRGTVDSQKEWIATLEESISERDAVIAELAKDIRPSVWVRLVESIPAVAAILAGLAK